MCSAGRDALNLLCVQIEEKIQQLDQSLEGLLRNLEHRRNLHNQNQEAQVTHSTLVTLFCLTVQLRMDDFWFCCFTLSLTLPPFLFLCWCFYFVVYMCVSEVYIHDCHRTFFVTFICSLPFRGCLFHHAYA